MKTSKKKFIYNALKLVKMANLISRLKKEINKFKLADRFITKGLISVDELLKTFADSEGFDIRWRDVGYNSCMDSIWNINFSGVEGQVIALGSIPYTSLMDQTYLVIPKKEGEENSRLAKLTRDLRLIGLNSELQPDIHTYREAVEKYQR